MEETAVVGHEVFGEQWVYGDSNRKSVREQGARRTRLRRRGVGAVRLSCQDADLERLDDAFPETHTSGTAPVYPPT